MKKLAIITAIALTLVSCTPATQEAARDRVFACVIETLLVPDAKATETLADCLKPVAIEVGKQEGKLYVIKTINELSDKAIVELGKQLEVPLEGLIETLRDRLIYEINLLIDEATI